MQNDKLVDSGQGAVDREGRFLRNLPLFKFEFVGGNYMKKVIQVICCAAGSGMIGFFANQLDTVVGSVCFTLGVVLLVASISIMSKKDN